MAKPNSSPGTLRLHNRSTMSYQVHLLNLCKREGEQRPVIDSSNEFIVGRDNIK